MHENEHVLTKAVEDQLSSWFDSFSNQSPSVSLGVFDRKGVLFHGGFGECDVEGARPLVETRYRIASMSKSFTAAAILILQERGLLSIEDRVSEYIPRFSDFEDSFGVRVPITIRMFLTHVSGLPEDNPWADHHFGMTHDEAYELLRSRLAYSLPPDERNQYSNLGFTALGLIIEVVSGEEYTQFVERHILQPLELLDTGYDLESAGAHPVASGYSSFDDGASWIQRPPVRSGVAAAIGGLYSSVRDIASWSAWLSAGFTASGGDSTLSLHSRRMMQRPWGSIETDMRSDQGRDSAVRDAGYGLGLVVESEPAYGQFCQHSGGLPGYSSNMRWHLRSGLGVAVLFNTEGIRASSYAADILRAVLAGTETRPADPPLWAETSASAQRVDLVLRSAGDLRDAGDLFSSNIDSDCPLSVRNTRIRRAIDEVGGLLASPPDWESRQLRSSSPAQAAWSIPGNEGSLKCVADMTMAHPLQVQRLTVEVAENEV